LIEADLIVRRQLVGSEPTEVDCFSHGCDAASELDDVPEGDGVLSRIVASAWPLVREVLRDTCITGHWA